MTDTTQALATFCAELSYTDIPEPVVARCEDFFVDWLASVAAGAPGHPTPVFEAFAQRMGPADGTAEILTQGRMTSPLFAAQVNAAASHLVEQDDVHNGAVFHPAAVVFPVALAVAQDCGASGAELITASVAGYEAGIRIGECLGRSHYEIFHTTATAGTLAAAVTAARLLKLDAHVMRQALGSAGTQAAGLWQFLRDGADSKQLHTAKASADGLLAAYMAADGLTGARDIIGGAQGMAAGMSHDADITRLADGLGKRWALSETSFKYHASCRHTHPAADALAALMIEHGLGHGDIKHVTAGVHQAAIDVLGTVDVPQTVHQAKFSMGTVLGLIAIHGRAGLNEFAEHALTDPLVAAFRDRVVMRLDADVDARYPKRWLGRVEVVTHDGRTLTGAVDEPKGDPGNTLDRDEIQTKFHELADFGGRLDQAAQTALLDTAWRLRDVSRVGCLLPDFLSATERPS